jgi:hypothetical protein
MREFERNWESGEALVFARMRIDEKQVGDTQIDRDITD